MLFFFFFCVLNYPDVLCGETRREEIDVPLERKERLENFLLRRFVMSHLVLGLQVRPTHSMYPRIQVRHCLRLRFRVIQWQSFSNHHNALVFYYSILPYLDDSHFAIFILFHWVSLSAADVKVLLMKILSRSFFPLIDLMRRKITIKNF